MKPYSKKQLDRYKTTRAPKQDNPRYIRKTRKHLYDCFMFVRKVLSYRHISWNGFVLKPSVESIVFRYNRNHASKVQVKDVEKLLIIE